MNQNSEIMEIIFEKVTASQRIPLIIKELYMSAFPEEERRPWADICQRIDNHDPFFAFYVLQHNGETVGFITLWRLPGALYCEHFAILGEKRGHGYGAAAVAEAIRMGGQNPLVLEVELPEKSEEAVRRIEFYTRCGLTAMAEFPYWQPAYRQDLKEVAMMLMTSRPLEDPSRFVIMLHTLVYNQ